MLSFLYFRCGQAAVIVHGYFESLPTGAFQDERSTFCGTSKPLVLVLGKELGVEGVDAGGNLGQIDGECDVFTGVIIVRSSINIEIIPLTSNTSLYAKRKPVINYIIITCGAIYFCNIADIVTLTIKYLCNTWIGFHLLPLDGSRKAPTTVLSF